MEVIQTPFEGALIIQPQVFSDNRGYFVETFNLQKLNNLGIELPLFVQDNESKSTKHVLRGLHFQRPPFAQGKLVRVVKGAVYDVAVDLRKLSPTYGQQFGVLLTEENKTQFWVPPGFAHGFVTLEEDTIFSYKCTNFYSAQHDGGILWNSSKLAIDWKVEHPILSEKDQNLPDFSQFDSPF